MSNVYKLSDVFMPVGVPHLTLVSRDSLERSILSWKMSSFKHLLLFGPSKSGKTTLWKKFVPNNSVIKISCNSSTSIENVYSSILFELETFYTSEIANNTSNKVGIATELCSILGVFNAKTQAKVELNNGNSSKKTSLISPEVDANLLIKYLKPSGKIIVIEDFHYTQEEFKHKISQDLKAFSDDACPWIIVGIQHKTSKLLSENMELQQRITEISVEGFTKEQLTQIVKLGESALNIQFSSEILECILDESYNNASLVQNICQRICLIKGVLETSSDLVLIDDHDLFIRACSEIAYEAKSYYGDIVKKISIGGRTGGTTEKYKWFLRMIRDKEVPEYGLKNTEVLAYLKELGHQDIQQSSVNAGLKYLPKLLDKNNIVSVFDYDGMHFYLLDRYMKFVFKWVPELIDNLFTSEIEAEFKKDNLSFIYNIAYQPIKVEPFVGLLKKFQELQDVLVKHSDNVSVFTRMIVTSDNRKTMTAEIQHPVLGKRNISAHDEQFKHILKKLKISDIVLPTDSNTDNLLGFESNVTLFYLGFLFTKGYIGYERLEEKNVRIFLTDEAKKKIKELKNKTSLDRSHV